MIHSFDLFQLDAYMIQNYIDPERDGVRTVGASCRDLFDRSVASVAPLVCVHHGDLRAIGWDGQPIEILFLDILKSADTNDVVLRKFFPALIPGRSVVIQQDYVHEGHFWIHITMELLREYFSYAEFVEFSSTVYFLRRAIPAEALEACQRVRCWASARVNRETHPGGATRQRRRRPVDFHVPAHYPHLA